CKAVVTLKNGEVITDELAIADAHPLGARPFARDNYVNKFTVLSDGVIEPQEQERFLSVAQGLANLKPGSLSELNPLVDAVLLRFPGAFSPLVAKLIQEIGFEGIYVSGAVLSADLGLPDIGLTTLTEVSARGRQIATVSDLPTLIDADTGFGEPMSAARTVTVLEDAGLSGCHFEDQVNPKRCGHLDGKAVVETAEMIRRLRAAVSARRDPNFVICARTDAAGIEGLPAAIDRAKAYADAGADLIFTEALSTIDEFEKFRAAVDVPLLSNMTEFGKSDLVTAGQLREVGYNVVIYPVTTLR
ncbi:2-methylcitrate dehydratase, partial [Aduncisulcus paluster]